LWLARALERIARHRRRSEHRRRQRETVASRLKSDVADPEVHERFEAQRELARLVGELVEPYRTLIIQRYYEGRSAADIARSSGVPAGTVRSQLARARALLRRSWRDNSVHGRRGGFAGLALIVGVAPDILRGGALMKIPQVGVAVAACAALLAGVLGTVWILDPVHPSGPSSEDLAPLTRADQRRVAAADDPSLGGDVASGDRQELGTAARAVQPEPGAEALAPTRLLARIVNEGGGVIGGAKIDAPEWEGFGTGTSDGAGHLVLAVPREHIQIWSGQPVPRLLRIVASGYSTRFLRAKMERDADTDMGDVVLAPGGAVVGRVVGGDGAPLEGARILATGAALGKSSVEARSVGPADDGERVETTTGADGAYRLDGMAAGAGRVWAHLQGRRWAFTPVVEIVQGVDNDAPDLILARPASSTLIRGVVLDPSGAPVSGAKVAASGLSAGVIRYARSQADDDGRFEIMAFDEGPHRIGAFHPEQQYTPTFVQRVMPGTDDLELRLTELRWIDLSILDDSSGDPVPEPWVNIDASGGMDLLEASAGPRPEVLGPGSVRVPLPATEFHINVSASGFEYLTVGPFQPNSMRESHEVRLVRKPMVSGRVLADGHGVEGARVSTMQEMKGFISLTVQGFRTRIFDGGKRATETDSDGRFELPISGSLPSGAHMVHVFKEGWATAEVVFEAEKGGGRDLEIELTRGGAIEGRVLLPAGSSPLGAIVAASNGDGRVRTARADADGIYRLEHLRPGPWEIEYWEEDRDFVMTQSAEPPQTPYEGDCVVQEGQTTVFDLDVRFKHAPVSGRVVIDGEPAQGWTARLENAATPFVRSVGTSTVLDADGAFALISDGVSTHVVIETPEFTTGFVRASRALANSGTGTDATLEVRTGRLTGTAAAGAELRFSLTVAGVWSYRAEVRAGADGDFAVDLPAGTVTVSVRRAMPGKFTRWIEEQVVEVSVGAEARVEVDE